MGKHLSRAYGMQLGRLPNYVDEFNTVSSQSPGAIRFRGRMQALALEHAQKRVNGKVSSYKTIEASKHALGSLAITIWGLNFQLQEPGGISEKHIRSVLHHEWAYGISAGSLSVMMTQIRKLATWIKKPGMVKDLGAYLPEVNPKEFQRQKNATKSKSPIGNGYELETIINKADAIDKRFGLMVRMEIVFGLRRNEVLQIKPHLDDRNLYLDIRHGVAKNGRLRIIPIETTIQRQVLNYAKSVVGFKEHIGWADASVDQKGLMKRNENRYDYYMQKLGLTKAQAGITGHGLRAQYAEDMAIGKGFVPSTLGGLKGQMTQEELDLARIQIAEDMGHSRISVTGAYFGSLKAKDTNTLGQLLGTLRLGLATIATVFINPPLIPQPSGEFGKMSARKMVSTDFTISISDDRTGIATEVGKIDLKDFSIDPQRTRDVLSPEEAERLLRLAPMLLEKFSIDWHQLRKISALHHIP